MSTLNHTPGPWKLYNKPQKQNQWIEAIGTRERGDIICLAPTDEHIDSLEMWEANAKLIEASPDLLEALIEAHKELRLLNVNKSGVQKQNTPASRAIKSAEAAIKKATE